MAGVPIGSVLLGYDLKEREKKISFRSKASVEGVKGLREVSNGDLCTQPYWTRASESAGRKSNTTRKLQMSTFPRFFSATCVWVKILDRYRHMEGGSPTVWALLIHLDKGTSQILKVD